MRHYIQFNRETGKVDGELFSGGIPGGGLTVPDNMVDVSGRVDGPWMGKIYDKRTDTFSLPPDPTLLLPIAVLSLYLAADPLNNLAGDPSKTPRSIFGMDEPVGVDVEIQDAEGKRVKEFTGVFNVPIMKYDPVSLKFTETIKRLKFEFMEGFASRTIDSFPSSGDFGIDQSVTSLARILSPVIITVWE
jgi:hypothetical protein